MSVRVRFAPSPTGYFHVGGARTALYNWLFARQHDGTFVLRIEDTDTERNREEWVGGIASALSWLGLSWDEGPVRQSERLDHYRQAASALVEVGRAYYCECSREQIEARGRPAGARPGGQPAGLGSGSAAGPTTRAAGYDGWCRDRELGPGPGRALRFRVPEGGSIVVHDLVRGAVSFEHDAIEDFVVVKSSGAPLFVLANAVDDRDMEITHVLRAEEHLATTPKYLLLWDVLSAHPPPVFAHLPMLVDERRQKLSKRRHPEAVAIETYRDKGYLAPAMVNYLALLGWGPGGDREILSLNELISEFRLEDVNQAPAYFDVRKLTHFNGVYLRALSVERFVDAATPWLERGPWPARRFDPGAFNRLAPLVQERVSTLGEVPAMVDFLFLEEPDVDPASWTKTMAADPVAARTALEAALALYGDCSWDAATLHQATSDMAEKLGRKLGQAQAPIRVAVTGRRVGPPLFESLEVLGRQVVCRRLAMALDKVAGPAGPPAEA